MTVIDKTTHNINRIFSRRVIRLQMKEGLRDEEDPLSKTSNPKGRRTFPLKNRREDRAPEVALLFLEDGLVM
jgi:hypothetical protein